MSLSVRSTSCCGVRDIDGLSDHSRNMEGAFRLFWPQFTGAFALFTCPTKNKYGERFKKYIEKHKLGSVVETERRKNPNSGNMLRAYLWTLDKKACQKHYQDLLAPTMHKLKIDRTAEIKEGSKVTATAPCDDNSRFIGMSGVVIRIEDRLHRLPVYVHWADGTHWWCERGSIAVLKSK